MSAPSSTRGIRTERLVGVHDTGHGLWNIVIVPLLLTIVGVVIALPLMIVVHELKKAAARDAIQAALRTQFPAFIGSKPEYMDTAVCGYGTDLKKLTGSGMAYAGGRIFVVEEGLAAEISWDDIRSWTWNVEGHEVTRVYGTSDLGTNLQVGNANYAARLKAERASGFTVSIDKPDWRFQTSNVAVLKRWMEILNHSPKPSRSPASAWP